MGGNVLPVTNLWVVCCVEKKSRIPIDQKWQDPWIWTSLNCFSFLVKEGELYFPLLMLYYGSIAAIKTAIRATSHCNEVDDTSPLSAAPRQVVLLGRARARKTKERQPRWRTTTWPQCWWRQTWYTTPSWSMRFVSRPIHSPLCWTWDLFRNSHPRRQLS